MPIWRMQCAWSLDTLFPRDKMIITPHFNDQGIGTDPQGLADDLAAALSAWDNTTTRIEVTAYDAQGTPPVNPQGSAVVNDAALQESGQPRELAVCLSFFGGQNIPGKRGRVYIPSNLLSGGLGRFVSTTSMNEVGQLPAIFSDLGGADVDWCVYSRRDDAAYAVTNWFVDNEWDTIRSRGLRADARVAGTVPDGA